jgi:hypothetical protein
MSKYNKLEKAKAELKAELEKQQPSKGIVTKLKRQIMLLGLGLTGRDIKPF